MRHVATLAAICIGLLMWGQGAMAQAPDPSCPVLRRDEAVSNYAARLIALKLCLGDPSEDPNPLSKSVAEALKTPPPSTAGVVKALEEIRIEAHKRVDEGHDPAMWSAMAGAIDRIANNASGLESGDDGLAFDRRAEVLVSSMWKGALDGGLLLDGARYDLALPPSECKNGQPCPRFDSRVAAMRVARLMSRVDAYLESPATLRSFADGRVRLARWKAYRDQAHPLYWWEVFLNGALMDSPVLGDNGKAPCTRVDGTSVGFCDVPARQIVLLHPEGALRFSRTATKSDALKPALAIELIGYYSWDWKAVDSAEMKNRRGVSLAATYTDTQAERRIGYGPMVHWNGYSFAVTKASGGKWSLVVSVPLAGELFGRRQKIVDELSSAKKSSFVDLLTE